MKRRRQRYSVPEGASSKIISVSMIIADATEHKQIRERLRQSEEHFQRLIENAPDLLSILDTETGTILYQGPSVERILGFTPEEMVGQKAFTFVHPDDLAQISQRFSTLIEQPHQPAKGEGRFRRKDGSWAHLEAIGRCAPELGGIVVNAWDITERKQAEEEIRALNATLELRIAERTRELAEANERLQELDRLKSKFVADVSHDLRAPLVNLHNHLRLLEQSRPGKRDQHMTVLKAQVNQLIDFVEDILDLSRLEREKETVRLEQVDLNRIVKQVVIASRPRAEAVGLELVYVPAADLSAVRGAGEHLERAIDNLVANAITYTPKGRVWISTFQVDGHVCVQVADTGIGIDPGDLPHLFDRFYRGRCASQLGISGTGLGLGIVKEIVEFHGGSVRVESQVGVGSIFTVFFPTLSEKQAGPA